MMGKSLLRYMFMRVGLKIPRSYRKIKTLSCLFTFSEWLLAPTGQMGVDLVENTPAYNLTHNAADIKVLSNDAKQQNVLLQGPKW
jgi:hypothetical protein